MSGQRIGVGLAGVRALYGRLQDYFGVWAIEPKTLLAAAEHVRSIDLVAHVRAQQRADHGGSSQAGSRGYAVLPGSIALIEASGTLMKAESSLEDSTSTVSLAAAIPRRRWRSQRGRRAVSDRFARRNGLRYRGPGRRRRRGPRPSNLFTHTRRTSAARPPTGLARKPRRCSRTQPVLHPASAPTWPSRTCRARLSRKGSRCTSFVPANSKALAHQEHRSQTSNLPSGQRVVDGLNEYFLAAVASGRKLSLAQVRQLADGRVHVAQDALKLKLLDGVQSLDATLAQLQKAAGTGGNQQARAAKSKPPAAKHAVPKQKLRRDVEAQYLQLVAAYAGRTAPPRGRLPRWRSPASIPTFMLNIERRVGV